MHTAAGGELQPVTRGRRAARNVDRSPVTDLVHRLGHEMRSPLSAVRSFTELLEDEVSGPLTDAQREYVRAILRNVDAVTRMTSWTRDAVELVEGAPSRDPEQVPVELAVTRLVLRFEEELRLNDVRLSSQAFESAACVLVDRARLDSALDEVLARAMRRTPSGGIVTLRAECDGERFRLEVRDVGEPLSAQEIESLTVQCDQSSMPAQCFGQCLGLALARRAITSMRGALTGSNTTERGATFTVELPCSTVQIGNGGQESRSE